MDYKIAGSDKTLNLSEDWDDEEVSAKLAELFPDEDIEVDFTETSPARPGEILVRLSHDCERFGGTIRLVP